MQIIMWTEKIKGGYEVRLSDTEDKDYGSYQVLHRSFSLPVLTKYMNFIATRMIDQTCFKIKNITFHGDNICYIWEIAPKVISTILERVRTV